MKRGFENGWRGFRCWALRCTRWIWSPWGRITYPRSRVIVLGRPVEWEAGQ